MKRVFDIAASLGSLIIIAPIFMAIMAWIKVSDGGSVFYRGVRAGRNGQPFRIYKFRTMVVNADKIGGPSTSEDDPRVTNLGKRLRRYKLDELPQLINVLKGEMSFVGPRPEVLEEVSLYTPEQRKLLLVRPGITDYASIRFHNEGEILRGAKDPHQAYKELIQPEKVRLGLAYVADHSFLTDLRIIALTIKTILGKA